MRDQRRIEGGRVKRHPLAVHAGKFTHSHKGRQKRQGQPLSRGRTAWPSLYNRRLLGPNLKPQERGNGRQRAQWRRAERLRQHLRDRIAVIPVLRKLVPFLIEPPSGLAGKTYPGKGRW